MKYDEINVKPKPELQKFLKEQRTKERELRFKISAQQMKNVREIRKIKKIIARIMTALNNKSEASAKTTKR